MSKKLKMNNSNISYLLNHNSIVVERQVTKGLEFILNHLNKPYWPRNISTKLTEGGQFTTYSRLEAYYLTLKIQTI
jgi:hypothetical protein